VDVGYRRHRVAMGLSDGGVLEEFEIEHRILRFSRFLFSHRKTPEGKELFGLLNQSVSNSLRDTPDCRMIDFRVPIRISS
jgi:hypothetical protein